MLRGLGNAGARQNLTNTALLSSGTKKGPREIGAKHEPYTSAKPPAGALRLFRLNLAAPDS